eukprot:GHVS01039043.1.p1 GENE.GHVS01039043.1~~GHVS01039043.1.p1  ORF type:complete len:554 (-),score=62.72 GHVS01039043.1:222-1883(-)
MAVVGLLSCTTGGRRLLLLLPCIGICCLLLLTTVLQQTHVVAVGSVLLPKLTGLVLNAPPSYYENEDGRELIVYDAPDTVGFNKLYFFRNLSNNTWNEEVKIACGKLFHVLAAEVVNINWFSAPDGKCGGQIDWKDALVVVRKGMEKGLLLPMGFVSSASGTSVVTPMSSDFNVLSDVKKSINLTSDLILQIAKRVTSATMFLHKYGVVHNRITSRNVVLRQEEHNNNTAYLSFLFDATTEGQTLSDSPFHMTPPNKSGKLEPVDSRYEVYTIGVMLAGLMIEEETRDMIDEIPKFVNGWQKNVEWLNIARFTAPYIFGETLIFGNELGNDTANRRLRIFCTFALIGDANFRPPLDGAAKYLTSATVPDHLLQLSVRSFLIPYALSLEAQNQRGRAKDNPSPYWIERFNYWETLGKPKLQEIDEYFKKITTMEQKICYKKTKIITTVNELKRKLKYQEYLSNYKQHINSNILSTPFYKQIQQTINKTLKDTFNFMHTFNFLFSDFIDYLTVDNLRAKGLLPVDKQGKAEYKKIKDKQTIFKGCAKILAKHLAD